MEHFPLVDRLHTDVLEEKYGPITSEIIKHDNNIRISHLIDENIISRTFAITFFPKKGLKGQVATIDKDIRKGTPIGKAFRKKGYAVRKNVIDVYIEKLPKWLKEAFKTKENFAKARLSEFYTKKKSTKPIIYGTVVEIYSPNFRGPVINNVDISQISASTQALEKVGFTKDEIWQHLGGDDWAQGQDKYMQAKKDSLPLVFSLKKKIKTVINKK